MANSVFRLADSDDAAQLYALAEAFAQESGSVLGASLSQLKWGYCAGRDGLHPTIIAEISGKTVAFLALSPSLGEVKALFVDRSHRGSGLARGLIETAQAFSPVRFAFSDQTAAKFYRALGWRSFETHLAILENSAYDLSPVHQANPTGDLSLELEDGALSLDWSSHDEDPRVVLLARPDIAFATLHPNLDGSAPEALWLRWGGELKPVILNVSA